MNRAIKIKLENLCRTYSTSWKVLASPSWTAEIYGFGKSIREYGYYPSWLPLCIYTDHSPGDRDSPALHELLATDIPVQMYHSPTRVLQWKELNKKPCYCLYSPFVFYRKSHKIKHSAKAIGTIAFPAHTTPAIDDVSDINVYIQQLKGLPDKFQPVHVCLHMADIEKGLHNIFLENGFNVHTAGHFYDDRFIERFYSIISNYKYATSNMTGSYLYYCVEMDIPFFLYGQEPDWINYSDTNIEKGRYTSYKNHKYFQDITRLFSNFSDKVSEEQKMYVIERLGMIDGIGRVKMAFVLYRALLQWLLHICRAKIYSWIKKLKNFLLKIIKLISQTVLVLDESLIIIQGITW